MNKKILLSLSFVLTISLSLFLLPAQDKGQTPLNKKDTTTPSDNGDTEQDPFDPKIDAPKYISVQTEFIELPTNLVTHLLLNDRTTTSDATPLRITVQELLEKGEARMLDTNLTIARSGDKATSESIEEFIYPTEYSSSPTPIPVDDNSGEKMRSIPTQYAGTPTAFETKNLGSTIEIEPRIGETDRIVDVRFLLQHTWHTGDTIWLESKDELGNISKNSLPNFYKIIVDTSTSFIPGQHVLISVNTPKDAEGKLDPSKKVIVFVKCKIIAVIE